MSIPSNILDNRLTKAEISASAAAFVDRIKAGTVNPLQAAAALKALEEFAKEARAAAAESIQQALDQWPNGKATFEGAKIERAETSVAYDYTACPIWVKLHLAAEEAVAARNAREAMLQKMPRMITEVDPDGGEVVECHPAVRTSTTTFKVSIPAK